MEIHEIEIASASPEVIELCELSRALQELQASNKKSSIEASNELLECIKSAGELYRERAKVMLKEYKAKDTKGGLSVVPGGKK